MKLNKKDIRIIYYSENCYRLSVRKTILFIFHKWIPLTYQESEYSIEKHIEFNSFLDAVSFIDNIVD